MARQTKADKDLVRRARRFFQRSSEFESDERNQALEDVRFVRLGDQWPDYAKRDRTRPGSERPMLTINRLQQFRNQIINEIRQQNPGVKFRPFDDKADIETAEMLDGLARHIEDTSRASIAYDVATEWAVDSGLGYFIVRTGYVNDDSFDQEILIEQVADRFKVYYDPLSEQPDGSDATEAMLIVEVNRPIAEKEYGLDDLSSFDDAGTGDVTGWWDEDKVRVAEYWYLEKRKRQYVMLQDGSTAFADELDPAHAEFVVQSRDVDATVCKWCKIAGDRIVDRTEIPCSMIPVIPVYGYVSWFQGRRHSYGLIRHGKDAQRAYNFWLSAETEMLALAPKAPFIGPKGFTEGNEVNWALANNASFAFLEYEPVFKGGHLLPGPQRQPFAGPPTGIVEAKQQAIDDMKASMGIYDASLGNRSNETSGKAINSRAMQAETANFHFSDNLGRAICQGWRIALEMVPKVYDTKRILRILGDDGTVSTATINPGQGQAVASATDQEGKVQKLFDLSVGRYDVVVDVGPSYATRRQENADKISQLVQASPPLMDKAGDILVQSMDFDKAEELAERLKKFLPPGIASDPNDDEDPEAALQQARAQMQQMAQQMEEMQGMFQELKSEHDLKMAELQIKQYDAETKRIAATKQEAQPEPDEMGNELAYVEKHAQHLLDEERLQLEREKAEKDYQLKLLDLTLRFQAQTQANEEVEEDQGEESSEPAKPEPMETLAESMREVMGAIAESQGKVSETLAQLAKPRKKNIVFDKTTGKPVGIEDSE